jgi:hypothetical protein
VTHGARRDRKYGPDTVPTHRSSKCRGRRNALFECRPTASARRESLGSPCSPLLRFRDCAPLGLLSPERIWKRHYWPNVLEHRSRPRSGRRDDSRKGRGGRNGPETLFTNIRPRFRSSHKLKAGSLNRSESRSSLQCELAHTRSGSRAIFSTRKA